VKNSLRAIFPHYQALLSAIYDEREAKSILYEYFAAKWNIAKYDIWLEIDKIFTEEEKRQMEADMARMLAYEPVQYVVENAIFYGLSLNVTPSVLIPRPETEELVQLILRAHTESMSLRILDVGCGSGAIAIALKKMLPNAQLWALDYSEDALKIAKKNALLYQVNINFIQADILTVESGKLPQVDIIVSNPPYIPERELSEMNKNVIDYEPHEALFVPDDDPLLFYREIAVKGTSLLSKGGSVYFETHHLYHQELIELLQNIGYQDIESLKDINGQSRFIVGRR
jgi:release factor glutamine methyltransferase